MLGLTKTVRLLPVPVTLAVIAVSWITGTHHTTKVVRALLFTRGVCAHVVICTHTHTHRSAHTHAITRGNTYIYIILIKYIP